MTTAKKAGKTKMDITRTMVSKELDKVGGEVGGLNRQKILGRLQSNKSTDMSAGQASRYYHMVLNEHAA
jgi:hypothetical protein